jgi:O-antigen ligase
VPDSRPLLLTGAAFALALLALWRGFASLSLERLVIAVAALVLFGLVFVRTEFGLYVLIFSMLLSPEFSFGPGFAERRAAVIRIEDVLLVVIAVAWLAKTAVNKEVGLVAKTPLNRPIAAYIAAQLVATLLGMVTGTVKTTSGLLYVVKYVEYFVVYYMVVNNLETRAQAWRLAGAAFLTAAIVSLNGIAQIPQGRRVSAPFEGTLGEPNTFGGYLLLMIAVAVGLAFETRSLRQRAMYTGLVGLMFLPFLYTLSRASYLAAIPVLLLLFVLFPRRRIVLSGIALAGIVLAILAPPEAVHRRVTYTFQGQAARDASTAASRFDPSTVERLESYESAIASWLERPLFGRGVTGFRFVDAQYPRLLVESGVVGFATFAWLIVALVTAVATVYRHADTPLVRGLAGGFLAGIAGTLVHGIGSNTFIIIRIMEPFWLLAAIVIAMPQLAERAAPRETFARPASWPAPVGAPDPARRG